jgi:GNAT superfamily N-acetyltransferase
MEIAVFDRAMESLVDYAQIPISFEVKEIFTVEPDGLGGFNLSIRPVDPPYVIDYDAIETGTGPKRWKQSFDLTNWRMFMAYTNDQLIGGAVIAFNTIGIDMLEGRKDLAVLWDIRVAPEVRGHGVGAALFRAAEKWSATSGCRQLKIETQNINVGACRFYQSQGCEIGSIDRSAYPEFPDQILILWFKDI